MLFPLVLLDLGLGFMCLGLRAELGFGCRASQGREPDSAEVVDPCSSQYTGTLQNVTPAYCTWPKPGRKLQPSFIQFSGDALQRRKEQLAQRWLLLACKHGTKVNLLF